jgi:hypothetical protein
MKPLEFPMDSWRSTAFVVVPVRTDQDEFEAGKREVVKTSEQQCHPAASRGFCLGLRGAWRPTNNVSLTDEI